MRICLVTFCYAISQQPCEIQRWLYSGHNISLTAPATGLVQIDNLQHTIYGESNGHVVEYFRPIRMCKLIHYSFYSIYGLLVHTIIKIYCQQCMYVLQLFTSFLSHYAITGYKTQIGSMQQWQHLSCYIWVKRLLTSTITGEHKAPLK